MSRDDFERDDEPSREDDRASRQRRIKNKRKDGRKPWQEQRIRPVRKNRPRVNVIHYHPEYDEDDYEEYYED